MLRPQTQAEAVEVTEAEMAKVEMPHRVYLDGPHGRQWIRVDEDTLVELIRSKQVLAHKLVQD